MRARSAAGRINLFPLVPLLLLHSVGELIVLLRQFLEMLPQRPVLRRQSAIVRRALSAVISRFHTR